MTQYFNGTTSYSEPGTSKLLCPQGLKSNGSLELKEYGFGKKKSRYGGIGPSNTTNLGLPEDVKSPETLSDTLPDQYYRGIALPRPYDRVDNQRMNSPDYIHGFGKKKGINKDIETLTKLKKIRKHSKKLIKSVKRTIRKKSQFSTTPGTDRWTDSIANRTFNGQDQVSEQHIDATGNFNTGMVYFQPGPDFDQRFDLRQNTNVPMQYTNNQMNTPIVGHAFGSKIGLDRSLGPNIVGYAPPIPMYHAGGTTMNYLTNQLYKPIGIIGGPTNSNGAYASVGTGQEILTVQPDYITPNAYLNTANGLPQDVAVNNANGLLQEGLGRSTRTTVESDFGFGKRKEKNRFSKDIMFTSNSYAADGPMYQKSPMYMKKSDINDTGDFASFGKKKKKLGVHIPDILKTKIQGNTVTLTRNGKVIVS